ncbi:MAG TPA: family 10 glycosylhydrolase [Methylomirabilota bacterium]|nr:family 10 glycosylhydrolase [Methylomirabilota bacterium]
MSERQPTHARTAYAGLLLALTAGLPSPGPGADYRPSGIKPPPMLREFRGTWVASVGNIDWPSRRDLPVTEQKAELLAILDRAVQLKLNAVILQVRPACDALYASRFEPWSEYLTAQMGRPPVPAYDPLAFAVTEAHARGLELHAWFNPFRARHTSASGPISPLHISRTQPNLVRAYGSLLWLDPGEPAARDYVVRVILDVVRRYDIDAVHIDDYFYPYPEKTAAGMVIPFPDGASYRKYRATGGRLALDDWRRDNVNRFVRRLHESIRAAKPHVRFGISPFGIWRPNHPPGIRGQDAYAELFADARKWMLEGWLDYVAPQLYWAIDAREQSFPALLHWWAAQNPLKRHLWPGLSHRHAPLEIVNQVRLTRADPRASGHIHWSIRPLLTDRLNVAGVLARDLYNEPALVPASTWLDRSPPGIPSLSARPVAGRMQVEWRSRTNETVWLWAVQTRTRETWRTQILPGSRGGIYWPADQAPDVIAVTAVDRCGNAARPVVLERVPPDGTSHR